MKSSISSCFRVVLFVTLAVLSIASVYGQNQNSAPHAREVSNAKGTTQSAAQTNTILLPVLGTGTTTFIPLWTGRQVIGNSILSQVPGGLNVAGAVTATSFFGDGSHLVNVNALSLQGLTSASFAQVRSSNTFIGDQTITGNLNLTGTVNESLSLQGNLSDALGEEAVNVIGGFQGDSLFPGNFVTPGVIGATIGGGGGAVATTSLPGKGQHARTPKLRPASFGVMPASNVVMANWGTVGGGAHNCANGVYATVGGGYMNCASAYGGAILGGAGNTASDNTMFYGTIAGGLANTTTASWASIGGGQDNAVNGDDATVAGGAANTANGGGASIGGGEANVASGSSSTVPGGFGNIAAGNYSLAAGFSADANFDGSFVWSDSASLNGAPTVTDTGANQFVPRASGGFYFYTASDLSTGATLPAGSGSWTSLSDRNVKENFSDVDSKTLLGKLAAMPILTWNYKAQATSVRHMGPTAQDFHQAFNLGEDEKHISTVDAQGVAFAAIQALYKLTLKKDAEISRLTQVLEDRTHELVSVEERLSRLESLTHSASVTNPQTMDQPALRGARFAH